MVSLIDLPCVGVTRQGITERKVLELGAFERNKQTRNNEVTHLKTLFASLTIKGHFLSWDLPIR